MSDTSAVGAASPGVTQARAGDMPIISIHIPEALWEPNDGIDVPTDRLIFKGQLVIQGVALHLEAWRIDLVGDIQEHLAFPDDLNMLHSAVGADGHFDTAIINGQEYVLVASPHC